MKCILPFLDINPNAFGITIMLPKEVGQKLLELDAEIIGVNGYYSREKIGLAIELSNTIQIKTVGTDGK